MSEHKSRNTSADEINDDLVSESLVEEVSIDGMCGVY
ncbi:mycofactocin precursor MftA [Gordonia jinhuaensis]|nr:mycofactocin precursor MftA [Gordonia jinhuaensis]